MKKLMIAAFCAALCVVMSGCGTPPKLNDAAAKGMYVNAATETMAIGYGKVTSIPGEREAFAGHYSEDTALLSPSTKTHSFDIFIVGSNATSQATAVVSAVCKAFGIVAPVISSNECAKSGITIYDLFKAGKAKSVNEIWDNLTPESKQKIEDLVASEASGRFNVQKLDGTTVEAKCENGDCEICTDGSSGDTGASGATN